MRWSRRPDGSNWGDFGEDDQLGRLNLITPECRLAAVREVTEGLAFQLSLPLDLPAPGYQPPFRQPPLLRSTTGHNVRVGTILGADDAIDIGNDDCVELSLQYSTQWDSLAHVGAMFDADGDGVPELRYYNGYLGGEHICDGDATSRPAALRLDVATQARSCVQGRGVLVDLHAALGSDKVKVSYSLLAQIMSEQSVTVGSGDILCIHTGTGDAILSAGTSGDVSWIDDSFAELDGRDPALLEWISASGVAAIVCDNGGVEGRPDTGAAHSGCGDHTVLLPLHHHCLFKLGLPLGELWYLGDLSRWLARAGRSRFLLTAPPLALPGAVGSPVSPVATV